MTQKMNLPTKISFLKKSNGRMTRLYNLKIIRYAGYERILYTNGIKETAIALLRMKKCVGLGAVVPV